MNMTETAARRICELARLEGEAPVLRISVNGGGCSGFRYDFGFRAEEISGDLHFTRDGATLVVDPQSATLLEGAELDYENGLMASKFVVRNPQAASGCGCGNSFSI